jgi:hypothetical protein
VIAVDAPLVPGLAARTDPALIKLIALGRVHHA